MLRSIGTRSSAQLPRLAMTGNDFAALLERSIERSGKAEAVRQIELGPSSDEQR